MPAPASEVRPIGAAHAGKYLTVVLGNEAYGLNVLQVREIIRLQKVTPIPQVPDFVKGVINLRGRIIPIVDLRVKFGIKATENEQNCIVVALIRFPGGPRIQMGLVVDAVEEVVGIAAAEIEPAPELGARIDTACLLGLAKGNGRVQALLDLDRLVVDDVPAAAASTRN